MNVSQEVGRIFDIQRFSTHDGDGIRTNVFLKGCSLVCVWCQNPEGIDPNVKPIWLSEKCIHCKACSKYAPDAVDWENNQLVINENYEGNWDLVIDQCPTTALRYNAKLFTVEQLIKELKKDEVFYSHGGGVTFSGGEPLLQINFLEKAIKKIKQHGWNTAIETALHVPWSSVEKVLPYLDTIFADFKIFDTEEHLKGVAAHNKLIKENITLLLKSKYKKNVIIRTPLIPEYTANIYNIREISKFISNLYPQVRYEILNYNPLAISKYPVDGLEFCFNQNPKPFSKSEINTFHKVALEAGITNLVIS